jgi:hypothetical protein
MSDRSFRSFNKPEETSKEENDGFTEVKNSRKLRKPEDNTSSSASASSSYPSGGSSYRNRDEDRSLAPQRNSSMMSNRRPHQPRPTLEDAPEMENLEAEAENLTITEISKKGGDVNLHSSWICWTHETDNSNWMLDSYVCFNPMKTVGSFWRFMNNLPMLGGIEARYYFIMRGQIEPTFEYPANRNGTIWSVMCELDMMDIICTRLCIAIMGETLLPAHLAYNPNKDTTLINGISLCVKGKPANRNGGSNNRSVGKCCLIKISHITSLRHAKIFAKPKI